ncbi:MAG: endonuclease III [Oligoflexales bacterium]
MSKFPNNFCETPVVTPRARKKILKEALTVWAEQMPDAKCELYHETPYQLLVSVVLSAQATDKSVNQAMEPLYYEGFTPQDVLEMGQVRFLDKIKTIGLAPTKSKNVLKLTKILVDRFRGEVPRTRKDLEALPGVGRKTANVVLGEVFGEPTLAVDTHVFRVSRRLGLHEELKPEKCEQVLLQQLKNSDLPKAHHWFILHGRYTCKARKPMCEECPLNHICPAYC